MLLTVGQSATRLVQRYSCASVSPPHNRQPGVGSELLQQGPQQGCIGGRAFPMNIWLWPLCRASRFQRRGAWRGGWPPAADSPRTRSSGPFSPLAAASSIDTDRPGAAPRCPDRGRRAPPNHRGSATAGMPACRPSPGRGPVGLRPTGRRPRRRPPAIAPGLRDGVRQLLDVLRLQRFMAARRDDTLRRKVVDSRSR